jgi:holliday junction DNA helicase RuvA
MISRLKGTLLHHEPERIEVETAGGVVYEIHVPLLVSQRLPALGAQVEVRTLHVVKEESATLYGFLEAHERELFSRLLGAKGVGGRLALSMMSMYQPRRLARALVEKDVALLSRVSGLGKKRAETIALELGDRMEDMALGSDGAPPVGAGVQEAVAALVSLGYSFPDADEAVHKALQSASFSSADDIVRKVLAG